MRWPVSPSGPATFLVDRLNEGYVLEPREYEELLLERDAAVRLEQTDAAFLRAAQAVAGDSSHSTLGWTVAPEGPSDELLERLKLGYVLTTAQHKRLLQEQQEASRLEQEDSRFARAAAAAQRRKAAPPPGTYTLGPSASVPVLRAAAQLQPSPAALLSPSKSPWRHAGSPGPRPSTAPDVTTRPFSPGTRPMTASTVASSAARPLTASATTASLATAATAAAFQTTMMSTTMMSTTMSRVASSASASALRRPLVEGGFEARQALPAKTALQPAGVPVLMGELYRLGCFVDPLQHWEEESPPSSGAADDAVAAALRWPSPRVRHDSRRPQTAPPPPPTKAAAPAPAPESGVAPASAAAAAPPPATAAAARRRERPPPSMLGVTGQRRPRTASYGRRPGGTSLWVWPEVHRPIVRPAPRGLLAPPPPAPPPEFLFFQTPLETQREAAAADTSSKPPPSTALPSAPPEAAEPPPYRPGANDPSETAIDACVLPAHRILDRDRQRRIEAQTDRMVLAVEKVGGGPQSSNFRGPRLVVGSPREGQLLATFPPETEGGILAQIEEAAVPPARGPGQQATTDEASRPGSPQAAVPLDVRGEPYPFGLTPFEQQLWNGFCVADADHSGSISRKEFFAILARVSGRKLSAHAKKMAFAAADTQRDGKVTWDEFRKIASARLVRRKADAHLRRASARILRGSTRLRSPHRIRPSPHLTSPHLTTAQRIRRCPRHRGPHRARRRAQEPTAPLPTHKQTLCAGVFGRRRRT